VGTWSRAFARQLSRRSRPEGALQTPPIAAPTLPLDFPPSRLGREDGSRQARPIRGMADDNGSLAVHSQHADESFNSNSDWSCNTGEIRIDEGWLSGIQLHAPTKLRIGGRVRLDSLVRSSRRFLSSIRFDNDLVVLKSWLLFNAPFEGCDSLNEVIWPGALEVIGDHLLCESGLMSVDLRRTQIRRLCDCAFAFCKRLSSLYVPATLEHIGFGCFGGTDLRTVELRHCRILACVGERVFQDCTALTELSLPVSVAQLGSHLLGGCHNLDVVSLGTPKVWVSDGLQWFRGFGTYSRCVRLFRLERRVMSGVNEMVVEFVQSGAVAFDFSRGMVAARPLSPAW
jgi:hypothetical protein